MLTGLRRTRRYASAWLRGGADVEEDELTLDRDGTPVPATLVRPRRAGKDLPLWIVLHGITRQGRGHEQLVRFTHAMSATGLAVLIPEVPEWRQLNLAPGLTMPTVRAAIDAARATGVVRHDPVGVLGFSFGAPHVIALPTFPEVRDDIAGVCGFGGYCELNSTFRFLLTGEHEWAGQTHRTRVDPYGRWIVAANFLTGVPEYEHAGAVADALRRLAGHAGDVGLASSNPVYDPVIEGLRADLAPEQRAVFSLFARPASEPAPEVDAHALGELLAEAGRRADAFIDPLPRLTEVSGPVHVVHGRHDVLIPSTEAFRMARALNRADVRCTVTSLFGHSAQEAFALLHAVREVPRFARAMSGILSVT